MFASACVFSSACESHHLIKPFPLPSADISGVDWMVRHGRSLALAIAVKCAPERLCEKEYGDVVMETILTNATADRVSR